VNDAIAELEDQTRSFAESAARNNQKRRAEAALTATSKRAKLAASVDEALAALACLMTFSGSRARREPLIGTSNMPVSSGGWIVDGLVFESRFEV